MKRPLQIGITGGIGSGKSLVCRIFQQLGVPVYDADSRAKELMVTDSILAGQIKKEFGTQSYSSDGGIDRTLLAQTVFNDPVKLEKLNRMVHPRVAEDYNHWVEQHRDKPYVIKEAALIFEAGSWKGLDKVIVVASPEGLRMKRILSRDTHRTANDVQAIINNQMPEEEKLKRADFVITNDESQLVIPQVLQLHEQLVRMS
ncbi:MAG TPA: dephospho-CoA kinase [Cyclobacteriaceae bacterium]|nr:dephospho-CoA kinase [Cyclobacteriaceae bacterium]